MTQQPLPSQGYVGWFRPQGGIWKPVVEAPTEQEARRLVIGYKPPGVQFCEKAVLPKGQHP